MNIPAKDQQSKGQGNNALGTTKRLLSHSFGRPQDPYLTHAGDTGAHAWGGAVGRRQTTGSPPRHRLHSRARALWVKMKGSGFLIVWEAGGECGERLAGSGALAGGSITCSGKPRQTRSDGRTDVTTCTSYGANHVLPRQVPGTELRLKIMTLCLGRHIQLRRHGQAAGSAKAAHRAVVRR
jgi:hypothetical protein